MKVSIIIPVYNTEHWVSDTINSIKNQTYKDWEAIFVIDGSTDKSEQIVRNESERDKRMLVINQDNLGLAKARDTGISHASGEYIMFLDSDDLLAPNALELSLKSAKQTGAEIVVGDFVTFKDTKNFTPKSKTASEEFKKAFPIQNRLIGHEDIDNYVFCSHGSCLSVCIKLFKTDFLLKNKICINVKVMEDMAFTAHLFLSTENIVITDNVLYYYRQNRLGSITAIRTIIFFDLFNVFLILKQTYKKFNCSMDRMLVLHYTWIHRFCYTMVNRIPIKNWLEYYKKLCSLVREEYKDIDLSKFPLSSRFFVYLLSKNKTIFLVPLTIIAYLCYKGLYSKIKWFIRPIIKPIITQLPNKSK